MPEKSEVRDAFLTTELDTLASTLHPLFTGAGPICLSVFQPTPQGGHLVLLDRTTNSKVSLKPGITARTGFLSPDEDAIWGDAEAEVEVTPEMIEFYLSNDESHRANLGAIYRARFGNRIDVQPAGHVPVGSTYRLYNLCPSPDYATKLDHRRVPRLGNIYSFQNLVTKAELSAHATAAATTILHIRLDTILGYQGDFCPEAESTLNAPQSPKRIAIQIANDLRTSLSERIFLMVTLLLAHHCFYPHDPVAAQLINRTAGDAGQVYGRHGWPAFPISNDDNRTTSQLMAAAVQDIAYLIHACDSKAHQFGVSERRQTIVEAISSSLPSAIALLCGKRLKKSYRAGLECMTIQHSNGALSAKLTWPNFDFNKFESWANSKNGDAAAKCYLSSVHPDGPDPSWSAKRYNLMDVLKNTGTEDRPSWVTERRNDWYISYARARCTYEYHYQNE
jgi:hypothetical protein